jgi:hypothetical protein
MPQCLHLIKHGNNFTFLKKVCYLLVEKCGIVKYSIYQYNFLLYSPHKKELEMFSEGLEVIVSRLLNCLRSLTLFIDNAIIVLSCLCVAKILLTDR